MEIIVAMGIFVVLVTVIITVFILSLQSQRQASFRQTSIDNLRFTMESMAQQIRISEIDYTKSYDLDTVAGIQDDEKELHLVDESNNEFSYFLETDSGSGKGVVKIKVKEQVSSFTDPSEINVVKLLFYIDPTTNPFSTADRCNEDTDCLSNSCTLKRVCEGGSNAGNVCTSDIQCPGGKCSDVAEIGFCQCSQDSECSTNNCPDPGGVGICLPFDNQPRVTIVVGFESVTVRPEDRKIVFLQTTVLSRIYKR